MNRIRLKRASKYTIQHISCVKENRGQAESTILVDKQSLLRLVMATGVVDI